MEEVLIKGEDECVGLGVKDWRGEMTNNRVDGFVKRVSILLSIKEAVCKVVYSSIGHPGKR
jgi:hypothetical protein